MITTSCYVLDGWPIHLVVHDDRGRWRILGSQSYRVVDERRARWDLMLARDPSLGTLPPLAPGSAAYRAGPHQPWGVIRG